MLILDERHQVHVVLASDDEDALTGVTVGVRVLKDVEQVATFVNLQKSKGPVGFESDPLRQTSILWFQ